MAKKKDEIQIRWSWKTFWIVILIITVIYLLIQSSVLYNEGQKLMGSFNQLKVCYEQSVRNCGSFYVPDIFNYFNYSN